MWRRVACAALLLLMLAPTVQAADVERSVPGGRWYSQAAQPGELGFALVDDQEARFWSEFRRLGGVDALGYPVSHRFRLDGFVVQATQRVILQWRPESGSVQFVNVFDRLHELGHDDWLLAHRQTPRPGRWDEVGKPWEAIVRDRLAVLDAWPAMRAAYHGTVGDPIQANGLPTSPVVDMGNHHALRAQRVVFQQWKEDVPWARRGQVTVALGGDIAKQLGALPSPALVPAAPGADSPVVAVPDRPAAAPTAPAAAGPIGRDPGTLLPDAGAVGAGARQVDDAALTGAVLAQGRPAPAAFEARLAELGYVRGHRRGFVRDAPEDPSPTRRYLVSTELSLFRSPEAAGAFWRLDASAGWRAAEPGIWLERLDAPTVGDESVAFKVVSGDVAARGYLLLFRRANAVASVSVLSQISLPRLDEVGGLARALDDRLVRAMQP